MNYENITWSKDFPKFIEYLESISEEKFRDFSKKITPGEFTMLGIRFPILRSIAKEISKYDYRSFLKVDDQNIFEIKILKGYIVGGIKDFEEYKDYFYKFLPSIDNWAICDTFIASSKIIKKHPSYFLDTVEKLLSTKDTYNNRVAFVILLDYFTTDEYIDKVFEIIDGYTSDEYYANMALAWLLAECYIKCPKQTKKYLKTHHFDREVMRYTIRKIKDSYRVSPEDKIFSETFLN